MNSTIHPVTDAEHNWVLDIIRQWGADFIVSRGRKVYPAVCEGFYALDDEGNKVGLVTYEIIGKQCEIITLDAFKKHVGIGSALVNRVQQIARTNNCTRLWLITTNDNLDAMRFYQRRGFTIAVVHINALEHSRTLKPSIPLVGQYGIPIRDEIEFEMLL